MPSGPYTLTADLCGDQLEAEEALDALIAGLKLKGHWLYQKNLTANQPSAVPAPSLNATEPSICEITIPSFDPEPDVDYWLEYSDDDWNTFNVISDNFNPSSVLYYAYTSTRKFRISCHLLGNNAYSMSVGPIT